MQESYLLEGQSRDLELSNMKGDSSYIEEME